MAGRSRDQNSSRSTRSRASSPWRAAGVETGALRAVAAGRARPPARDLLAAAGLALITLLAFRHVGDCSFLHYDDKVYVTECGPVIGGLSWRGLGWAWSTFHAGWFQPLTWMSLQLDATLFGVSARAFHWTNLGLHTANVLLFFFIFRALTRATWLSATAAALFAVHPLRVESVAWVAERKDVLSVFFGLLAIGAYAWYAQRPGWRRYLPVCLAYAASLLSKPTLVTLPVLLLLLDYWPLGRMSGPILLEKLPLFFLALACSVLTLFAEHSRGGLATLESVSVADRLANGLWTIAAYLGQTLWPTRLAVLYPRLPIGWGQLLGAAAILMLIALALWRWRRRAAIVGCCWFLIALLPTIGLIQVGEQARADRFTYVPHLGLLAGMVWLAAELLERYRVPWQGKAFLAGTAILTLASLTSIQVGYWRDARNLWTHTLEATEPVPHWTCLLNLSKALEEQAQHRTAAGGASATSLREAAWRYMERGVALNPTSPFGHQQLGIVLWGLHKYDEARHELLEAIHLDPTLPWPHRSLGMMELERGRPADAEVQFREALLAAPRREEVGPDQDELTTRVMLGRTLRAQGRLEEAAEQMRIVEESQRKYVGGK